MPGGLSSLAETPLGIWKVGRDSDGDMGSLLFLEVEEVRTVTQQGLSAESTSRAMPTFKHQVEEEKTVKQNDGELVV